MSVVRTCLPCRTAKAKESFCDRGRPACGRCEQRQVACSGLPADEGFIFRDENEASQRNSERARRQPRETQTTAISLDLKLSQADQKQRMQGVSYTSDPDLQLNYSWLNQQSLARMPDVLKRDLETRAVDRFFVNWTLYPPNNETSTGYLNDLPMLYLSAPPQSVLWQAVRSVAFADMKYASAGKIPFNIMAQRHYGAALSGIRAAAFDEQELVNDHVLAAIILIDNFESLFLARMEPLGPHRDAVKYIVRAVGDKHLFSRSRFALWCVAHQRLQSQQILLGEQPSMEQLSWVSQLNIDRPDVHISSDILNMAFLNAAVKNLIYDVGDYGVEVSEKIEMSRHLAYKGQELIKSMEKWTSEIESGWSPMKSRSQSIPQLQEAGDSIDDCGPCPSWPITSNDHDIWLSYKLKSHSASQIVFRESLVDLIKFTANIQSQEVDLINQENIIAQKNAIDRLSAKIIRSYPSFLGFSPKDSEESLSPLQGRMAGRLFSIFPMWVIQRAKLTSDEHKRTAAEVIQWINFRHGLG